MVFSPKPGIRFGAAMHNPERTTLTHLNLKKGLAHRCGAPWWCAFAINSAC